MSNYPPGVTGNEPAIAGHPEGNYRVSECKGYMPESSRAVPEHIISEILTLQEAIGRNEPVQPRLERLRLEMLAMPQAVDVECNYEGDVDAYFSGGPSAYTVYWTCPRCGSEQEEDREAGDDHPDL